MPGLSEEMFDHLLMYWNTLLWKNKAALYKGTIHKKRPNPVCTYLHYTQIYNEKMTE